jgi:hypothetical protein
MKRVALLCPGPSLNDTWPRERESDYDLVVAVNTAGWRYTCDWLVFADRHIPERIRADGLHWPRIGAVTNGAHSLPDGLIRYPAPLGFRQSQWLTPAMRELAEKQGYSECPWTFPSALVFAQHMARHGSVHVFGYDATTDKVDAGGWAGGYHNPPRWERETPWIRLAWGMLCPCIQHGRSVIP